MFCAYFRLYKYYCGCNSISSCFSDIKKVWYSESSQENEVEQATTTTHTVSAVVVRTFTGKNEEAVSNITGAKSSFLDLPYETAAPVYAKPRGTGKNVYKTEIGEDGQQIANYVLFEDSMAKAKVVWRAYSGMTTDERDIYMTHLKAIRERRLSYKDPKTGSQVKTVSQHLLRGKCCGSGCRHCPYQHANATVEIRKSKIWNGAFYV